MKGRWPFGWSAVLLLWSWSGLAGQVAALAPAPTSTPGELLLRLRLGAGKAAALEELHSRYEVYGQQTLIESSGAAKGAGAVWGQWVRLQYAAAAAPEDVAAAYRQTAAVEAAVPNYIRRLAAADSLRGQQWNLDRMGWSRPEAGPAVIVGVIDSGLDRGHPDIQENLWVNAAEAGGRAGVDDDGNGYIDDINGWDFTDAPHLPGTGDYLERDRDPADESSHGTHVAGIIAAACNGRGIAGVAPGARIMVLRAGFNLAGGGSFLQDDDIAAALVYAADNGAEVVNMSFGDPRFSPLLQDAVGYAAAAGVVLVAATGNEGESRAFYPARFDEVIAVTAEGRDGAVASFSNGGPAVDIAAPGVRVLSLLPGGGYGERSGTSMAAAHVAAWVAVYKGRRPLATAAAVRAAMAAAAADAAPAGWDVRAGNGLLRFAAPGQSTAAGIEIRSPRTDDFVTGTVDVILQASDASAEEAELNWGSGTDPRRWRPLAIDGDMARWQVDALPSGTYTLRARLGSYEDRVAVQIGPAAPVVSGLSVQAVLSGGAWRYMARWDRPLPGPQELLVRPLAGPDPVRRIAVAADRLQVRQPLPDDLPAGPYRLEVGAVGIEVDLLRPALQKWRLGRLARLPDGYLLPALSDYDADGRAEVVLMEEGGGGYGPVGFYQVEAGGGTRVHRSSRLFIPWAVTDVDGDGRSELMAVDARRVRLLEAAAPGQFPQQVIWEQRDVWGGEVGDMDGDGATEMYLRGADAPLLRVFEAVGDDRIAETGALANPTTGDNDLNERHVLADLDGDGRPDLAVGDIDGDLFVYEAQADNAWRASWRQEDRRQAGAVRLLGGGADVDGDGRREWIVGRYLQPGFDLEQRRWTLTVYQATADDGYAPEWEIEVLGGQPGGNGVALADVDGDGLPEFVVALPPDLYVLQAAGVDRYEPVWHGPSGLARQPAVGDVDGDGRLDIVFNEAQEVGVWTLQAADGVLPPPAFLRAIPRAAGVVDLAWAAVSGAATYRIRRDGQVLVEAWTGTAWTDTAAMGDRVYDVAGRTLDGAVGSLAEDRAAAGGAVRVERLERLGPRRLALHLSGEGRVPFAEPYRFVLEPDLAAVTALADRGGRRVLLSFGQALPDSGQVRLRIDGVFGQEGALEGGTFALPPFREDTRLVGVETPSALEVILRFSGAVQLPAGPESVFFVGEGPRIVGIEAEGEDVLRLALDAGTPLQGLGQTYEVLLADLRDGNARPVEGRARFFYAPVRLDRVRPFPNPFRPAAGPLRLGGLPPGTRIGIYAPDGALVRRLLESDGDGAVEWDGSNTAGHAVGTGVYFYHAVAGAQQATGKFALIRP